MVFATKDRQQTLLTFEYNIKRPTEPKMVNSRA